MASLKQIILVLALLVGTSCLSLAKVKIPLGEREVLNKVHDLPDTDEFKLENGSYLDLATLHTEFNIAYILPLYITAAPKLVGYDEKTKEYYDIPAKELETLLIEQKLKSSNLNKLPFYTQYGGKLVGLALIAFIIWGFIPSKKKKIEPKNI
ncbi:MAG: hypothetical protein LBE37_00755 [Sphingobacterium sp.]|jgi:hypothetical protein|nr:hypothetical protein [Sphingobacterium sp.]